MTIIKVKVEANHKVEIKMYVDNNYNWDKNYTERYNTGRDAYKLLYIIYIAVYLYIYISIITISIYLYKII